MKKKVFITILILSAIVIAAYELVQYKGKLAEEQMQEVINWQQMPEFIQAVKDANNKQQLVDIKQYPFLADKGFAVAGVDYENCVWIGKKVKVADELYYCEDKKTNFNREQNSSKLKKQLSDHWFWCERYM